MTAYPILFNTEMVGAILGGYKTQTRRVIQIRNTVSTEDRSFNHNTEINAVLKHSQDYWCFSLKWNVQWIRYYDATTIKCPYGDVGDRLWVRETWSKVEPEIAPSEFPDGILYKASWNYPDVKPTWKPSIFMPRWASRIELEVVNTKVERVKDISNDDAKAEGVWAIDSLLGSPNYRAAYEFLWDEINKKRGYSWASNPWVWVIEFRKVE